MSALPLLELRGIRKSFGSVQALGGVDFTLLPGEVHALLGENGAGKSTLLRIADGLVRPDGGAIRVRGPSGEGGMHSPRQARAAGIGMVHQHFTSIDALTVTENIALATGRISAPLASESPFVRTMLEGFDPAVPAGSLGVARRQQLEILKVLAAGARILLLDEPTALLAPREVDALLALLQSFAETGGAVALVTHKLPEVFVAAQRVTVLRQGLITFSGAVPSREDGTSLLAQAMIGDATVPGLIAEAQESPPENTGPGRLPVVEVGDIHIFPGELVGLAAVEGNGQQELLRRIASVPGSRAAPDSVAIKVEGPVAFVPEDRTTEGLIPEMTLTENVVLALDRDSRWTRGPWINWKAARAHTNWLIWNFGIHAAGPDAKVGTLSGGNQQKVLLARALESGPRVLIAENPTRGLDIAASAAVHQRLRAAARAGVAVIVYSTDLDEVLELGRRVLVVHRGRVREAPPRAGRGTVGELMLGLGTA